MRAVWHGVFLPGSAGSEDGWAEARHMKKHEATVEKIFKGLRRTR